MLLEHTTLLKKAEVYRHFLTGSTGGTNEGYKEYSRDDFMSWVCSTNTTQTDKQGSLVYDSLLAFKSGEEDVNLVKTNNHKMLLGEPPRIRNTLNRSNMKPVDVQYRLMEILYFNGGGLLHPKDMIKSIHSFFVAEGSDLKVNQSSVEVLANIKNSDQLINASRNLTRTQLIDIANECRDYTTENDARENKLDAEEVEYILKGLVCEAPFNSTSFLNEIVCQFLEAENHMQSFLKKTEHWKDVEEDEILILENKVLDKTINILDGRVGVMREELYCIAMPPRFILSGQDSTPSLEILTQHLLGASCGHIKAIAEISKFSDLEGIDDSSTLLAIMERELKRIENSNAHEILNNECFLPTQEINDKYSRSLICEWGRIMWFVVYVEMMRNLDASVMTLKITNYEEAISDMNVYYVKGYYYCQVKGEGYVSGCFRKLLSCVYKKINYK